jgi:hypothetical protein
VRRIHAKGECGMRTGKRLLFAYVFIAFYIAGLCSSLIPGEMKILQAGVGFIIGAWGWICAGIFYNGIHSFRSGGKEKEK